MLTMSLTILTSCSTHLTRFKDADTKFTSLLLLGPFSKMTGSEGNMKYKWPSDTPGQMGEIDVGQTVDEANSEKQVQGVRAIAQGIVQGILASQLPVPIPPAPEASVNAQPLGPPQ